ncbi:hypothetical protein XENOCAPTIV_009453 [Xenoophorus captivus]|uniref:EMI domain-containing protein n=1 Tax=Xenoophorus captivus TaxID=1517983 RepID=A0ABV0QV60_9TELE
MALCYLYALCVWIGLLHPSLGTGFVYRFPGITLQRHRLHSEQSSGAGPPGPGSSLRNWCQYTVSRTVPCKVHNGTETSVQRVMPACRWPGPCNKAISYRTVIKPSFKITYKQITALEWRCCPGFVGLECREGASFSAVERSGSGCHRPQTLGLRKRPKTGRAAMVSGRKKQ